MTDIAAAVKLAERHVAYRKEWPTGDVTIYVADHDAIASALLALAERCEAMEKVVEAVMRMTEPGAADGAVRSVHAAAAAYRSRGAR